MRRPDLVLFLYGEEGLDAPPFGRPIQETLRQLGSQEFPERLHVLVPAEPRVIEGEQRAE